MTKLWGGRFTKGTDKVVEDFHSSISFDQRFYKHDILGSQAHARMLARIGVLNEAEAETIVTSLNAILTDIEAGQVEFEVGAEDIHMNIEKLLTERIGELGKKLHTARSRNDQVALDGRLYLRDELKEIIKLICSLQQVIVQLATNHSETIMPGYTHLQRAQPITFGHHLMAYFQMFERDVDRLKDCYKRVNVSPLGSGALAGTTFPLDRAFVAEQLGFAGVTDNSLDGVSDRDWAIEFCSSASLIMMHLSRFCEELVNWSSAEFAFVEMDDAYSTGSSMMPQKKNPDVAELIRGKTGRVYGDLMGLLTVMKGLPLAYNKDMQEDKEALFDAIDTVKGCLLVFTPMLETLRVKAGNMLKAAKGGFTNATDYADYLVKKGVPFRTAHEVVGKTVLFCVEQGKDLDELSLSDYQQFSELIAADIYEAISVVTCVEQRKVQGGPAATALAEAIKRGKELIIATQSYLA